MATRQAGARADAVRLALAVISAVFSGAGLIAWLGGGPLGVTVAVVSGVLIFALVMIVYPRVSVKEVGQETPQEPPERPAVPVITKSKSPAKPTPPSPRRVCEPGPHDVEGGAVFSLELDVQEGERVEGILHELDGYDFDWYIVDRANLVAALNWGPFDEEVGGEDVSTDEVDWRVPRRGPWYLLFMAPRKQYTREIEVDLTVTR